MIGFSDNHLVLFLLTTNGGRVNRLKLKNGKENLKVQSCKLCNNKYTIASTQIKNTEIFAFMAALVFKLLSCKDLFKNIKDDRNS